MPLKGIISLKIKAIGEVKEEVLGLDLKEVEEEEIPTMASRVLIAIRWTIQWKSATQNMGIHLSINKGMITTKILWKKGANRKESNKFVISI